MYIYIHIRMYTYMYIYIYVYKTICIYICIHIYTYAYIYIYIFIYIHIYIYINVSSKRFWSLQPAATHHNTLRPAMHSQCRASNLTSPLQHVQTLCNPLNFTARHLQCRSSNLTSLLQHVETHCNTLKLTARHLQCRSSKRCSHWLRALASTRYPSISTPQKKNLYISAKDRRLVLNDDCDDCD